MTELKPFQLEGARWIYRFGGRALLADEQGLGKTIQALYWVTKTPQTRPVVIVAPASVKYTWQSEAALHFNLRAEVLEGHYRPSKRRLPQLPGDVVILNYDILDSWLPVLLKADPQCVIFDEVHYCKNMKARRTKAALKLAKRARSVIGLSGTPLTNRPIELWPVLQIIRPDIFPSQPKFAWRYCKPKWTPWGWQYNGAAHLDELHRILRENCMIRRLKREVLPELPDKTRAVVSFRLDNYSEYQKADTQFIEWLRELSPLRASRAKKSEALTKIGYLLRLTAKLKLNWTERWIREFLENHPDQKLVALTMNTFVVDHLQEAFPGSVIIDGRVTGRKRDETVRKFQSNRRVRLLIGNWKAAGVGITLTAAATAAALDFPWTPGDLLQGEDRIHRIGQKKNVTVYYLAALNTVEEKLMKVLRKKSKVLDEVLNGTTKSQDLDIFDELISEIKRNLLRS